MRLATTAFALAALVTPASGYELPSFKDKLFAYGTVLEDGGDSTRIEYKPKRDFHGRDEVLRYKVKWKYVSKSVRWHRKASSYKAEGRNNRVYVVGRSKTPKVAVVFVHGRNGTFRLGVKDRTFGGNFNRLQNLLVRGEGRYYSAGFTNFGTKGEADLAALMTRIEKEAPNAAIVFACTSTGARLCLKLATKDETKDRVDGLMLVGGLWDDRAIGKADFPIVIAHGTKDHVYDVDRMRQFAGDLRKGGRKVRWVEVEAGYHATPLRLIDWRKEINWILANQ